MKEIAAGVLVTLVASIISVAAWMIIFIHFAIVPEGTAYPEGWSTLTSKEQVDWLRTHTVVLSGFEGSVYMLKHFSKYSSQFTAMFMMTFVSAALAVAGWRHLMRNDPAQTGDGPDPDRFMEPLRDKE